MIKHKFAESRRHVCQALGLMQVIAAVTMMTGCERVQELPDGAQTIRGVPSSSYVDVVDGSVTLRTHEVPLQELLTEIARQSNIEFLLQGELHERVTMEFHELPLPSAIGRILRNQSFALQYISTAGNQTDADIPPNRLWVFANGGQQLDRQKSTVGDVVATTLPSPVDEQATRLTFALAHEDAELRLEAVSALPNLKGRRAPPVLENAALHDWDPAMRVEALDALGDSGDHRVLPILEQPLYDPASQVRDAAIDAIANIGGGESIAALETALNSTDADVREEAVDALGDVGGATAIALLQQALADEQRSVREAAAEYLSELSDQADTTY
jgi:hypothetical protein